MGDRVRLFVTKNAIVGQCSDWFETPLRRWPSTRAFEWSNSDVNPMQPSKVMAKLLKSSCVKLLPIFGIATAGPMRHRIAIISFAVI